MSDQIHVLVLSLLFCGAFGGAQQGATTPEPEPAVDPVAGEGEEAEVECVPVRCEIYCEYGFAKDGNDCETCDCAEPPEPCAFIGAGGACFDTRDALCASMECPDARCACTEASSRNSCACRAE